MSEASDEPEPSEHADTDPPLTWLQKFGLAMLVLAGVVILFLVTFPYVASEQSPTPIPPSHQTTNPP